MRLVVTSVLFLIGLLPATGYTHSLLLAEASASEVNHNVVAQNVERPDDSMASTAMPQNNSAGKTSQKAGKSENVPGLQPGDQQVQNPVQTSAEQKQSNVVYKSMAQMDELLKLGVPALALSLLDGEQKNFQQFSPEWYSFEYKRILLLAEQNRWQSLLDRAQWVLDTARDGYQITSKIKTWFRTQQAIARLQLKQPDAALALLQQLIWQTKSDDRPPQLSTLWRQLVIRAYLQQGNNQDARRALVTYQTEYHDQAQSTDWLILQARVQMETGRPQQAIETLSNIKNPDALDVKTLRLIAELKVSPEKAEGILTEMRQLLDGKVLGQYERWAYAYVAYQASLVTRDIPSQIENLESLLSIRLEIPLFDDGFQVDADELWSLYAKYGQQLANDKGLLLGASSSWQKVVQLRTSNPPQALAISAAWVLQFKDQQLPEQHRTIVEILEQSKKSLGLINQLYLNSRQVNAVKQLPEDVRYRLVDYALSEGNYQDAVALMNTLEEPPEGKTLFDWRMRKARLLVLEGEYQESENLIRKTFSEMRSITRDDLDRYLQVVFDFQTVQEHERALRLFNLISFDSLDEKLKREMYFWKAESNFALQQFDQAALYYLESAYVVTDGENDLWAQSARFKAATSLMKAGIYDDAEKVFAELETITASESRKALIEQNRQKIRLLKSTERHQ